jgi:hypothetical protein
MKRAIIRTFWGDAHIPRAMTKVRKDLIRARTYPVQIPCMNMVYGEENYRFLRELGFDAILVDKRPVVWYECITRHKFDVMQKAMSDFDEIIFIDWDTEPLKPLTENFWEKFYEKDVIQAPLFQFKRIKAPWRINRRVEPSAAFIYLRDKSVIEDCIKMWESGNRLQTEQQIMLLYMDKRAGCEVGPHDWWDKYEPYCCYLAKSAIPMELRGLKDPFFTYLGMPKHITLDQ